MQAGDLKHRITIQQNTNDGTQDPSPSDWQTICETWAAKKGLTGRLFYQAAAAQSENDVIFTIRFRTGIKPTMRIVEGTELAYEIYSEPVDIGDKRQWMELHARRIDINGG